MNGIKESLDSRLTDYPKDWDIKPLGDMGIFKRGKGILKSKTVGSGIPCVMYGEIYTQHQYFIKRFSSFINRNVAKKSERIYKGDLLFAGSGETMKDIGKSVALLSDVEAYAGGDIVIFRPNNVNSLYLSYTLNNGKLAIERAKLGQGHSVVHIYPKDLQHLKIPLPSLEEQQKIASILSTWEKAIDLKEKLIEQKKEQKKGLMQKLLTGEVRLPGFDGEWEKIKIKDFCTTYSGGTPSRARKEFFENATIPWIKSGELNNRKVVSTEEYITKLALESSSAKIVYPNTVLIALYGATAGVVAINKIEASINQAILAVVPKGECENDFLFYFLESIMPDVVKKYTQGGQPNLNAEIVKNLILELPTTKEQRVIAKVISTLDDEITLLTKVFEEYRNQKKGLMQNLLTGKVRVKV